MNTKQADAYLAELNTIKKNLNDIYKGMVDKTIAQNEAHVKIRCMDCLTKAIVTQTHLDGILMAINRSQSEERKDQTVRGRSFQKVNYR